MTMRFHTCSRCGKTRPAAYIMWRLPAAGGGQADPQSDELRLCPQCVEAEAEEL